MLIVITCNEIPESWVICQRVEIGTLQTQNEASSFFWIRAALPLNHEGVWVWLGLLFSHVCIQPLTFKLFLSPRSRDIFSVNPFLPCLLFTFIRALGRRTQSDGHHHAPTTHILPPHSLPSYRRTWFAFQTTGKKWGQRVLSSFMFLFLQTVAL